MARARHSYAVRLEVEGGNRVKADLRSVGASGERSIKKIDRASDRASRGLGTLSDRASALRRHMRLLGGVIAAAAVGRGLQQMVKLYADFETGLIGVGKTADLSGPNSKPWARISMSFPSACRWPRTSCSPSPKAPASSG